MLNVFMIVLQNLEIAETMEPKKLDSIQTRPAPPVNYQTLPPGPSNKLYC